MQIGLEITKSTPSEQSWGQRIAQKLSGDSLRPIIYSSSHLRNDGRKRSEDELFEDMFNNPQYVDMAEDRRRWCEDIRAQWERRRKKLNEPTPPDLMKTGCLSGTNEGLGDDFSTLTNIQGEVLRTRFFVDEGAEFHRVFVLSGNYTFDFVPGKVRFFHEKANEVTAWINSRAKLGQEPVD